MPGSIEPKWFRLRPRHNSGSATLQLAMYELHYVSQYIVINKPFCNKQLILVFSFLFSVALAQNTTGVTTATTMAAAGRNAPLAPHKRPCAPRQHVEWMGNNPPRLRMYFLGWLRMFMDLKRSFVPAMTNRHNIGVFWGPYSPSTTPKIISACPGGYPTSIWRVGAEQKVSCGALGGHFHRRRLWSAMVVLVDVVRWRHTSDRPT